MRCLVVSCLLLPLGVAGCGEDPADVPVRSPAEVVSAALLGDQQPCTRPSDCLSGVCFSGECGALVDAGQPWKTVAIASTLAPQLATAEGLETARKLLTELTRRDAESAGGDAPGASEFVREHVAIFLGAAGVTDLAPILDLLKDDPDPAVALQVRLATLALRGPPAGDDAEAWLDEPVAIRLATIDALGRYIARTHDAAVASMLLSVATDTDEDHRVAQRALVALLDAPAPSADALRPLQALGVDPSEGYLAHDVRRLLRRWGQTPASPGT